MRIDGNPPIQSMSGETRAHSAHRSDIGASIDNDRSEFERLEPHNAADRRSPLPLDSAVVQQTKDRIRQWVDEIQESTTRPISPREFLRFALPRILQAMGAEGIGVWVWDSECEWRLFEASQLARNLCQPLALPELTRHESVEPPLALLDRLESELATVVSDDVDSRTSSEFDGNEALLPSHEHRQLLDAVRKENQPVLVPPRDVVVGSNRPRNPLDSLLILCPIPVQIEGGELWLEIVQPPSGGPSSQRGYLRFASQMSDLIAEFFRQHRTRLIEQERRYLATTRLLLDSFARDPRTSVAKALSSIQMEENAEHVVLLQRSRARWRVLAVAGLERLDRRADAISSTEKLVMDLERQSGGSRCVEGEADRTATGDMTWRQSLGIARYVWLQPFAIDTSQIADGGGTLRSLFESKTQWLPSRENSDRGFSLLMTWSDGVIPHKDCAPRAALTLKLLANVPSSSNPLRDGGRSSRFAKLRSLVGAKVLIGASLLFSVLSVLAIPVPIQIEATATLSPQSVHEIFAPEEGIVTEVLVHRGERVKAGDLCLRITSPKLLAERDQMLATHAKTEQRLREVQDRLLRDRSLPASQRDSLESERMALEEIHRLEMSTLALIESQCRSLSVTAPRDGVIETWDIETKLQDRPLRIGQWLFSIRDETDGWYFDTKIPEQKLEELVNGTKEQTKAFARLLASPQSTIELDLEKDSKWRTERSETDSEPRSGSRQSFVTIKLKPRTSIPADLAMTGAGARVAIETGRGPLGWALVKDFVQGVVYRVKMWIP
ncbi:HlyD family secretion protein [Pirellula sp. SH-Sr6A]|uniref:efflux RND transporter periplasmic adaptor subunit n=1 Tax=Pirellula sp. SH-Sr6A TaxID=1632865 RepID=UPI00078B2F58|nr:efflux RND transporter periplasmic adaptor subunit [Pirellula sp. SH-Sr6A]AMV30667.1 HlyD family secretion protein [Pirellula sp. SH-Sr6A]